MRFLKSSLKVGLLAHLVFTVSLLFIGEYTTAILLQLVYLVVFNNVAYGYFYIPLLHFILVKLFASSYYLLYFFNLFIILSLVNYLKININFKAILYFIMIVFLIYSLVFFFDEFLYDIYILIDINDKINFISYQAQLSLLFLHTILFMFISMRFRLKSF